MMTAAPVYLNRRFRRATENNTRPFRGLFDDTFKLDPTWPDLLAMRRVVILAEAGSGKSTEFASQCAGLTASGNFAFSASVRDVAQAGLEGALVSAERSRLAAWKADDTAECWLFIDSVDEARDQGVHFDAAARVLGDAIAGYEERTHIYISSRFTDWDATSDRVSMEKWLAMPEPPPAPAPDFAQDVRDTLHNKSRPTPVEAKDPIAVLVMEPLDRHQVKCFAEGCGIDNVEAFIAAVDHGNLWTFAARPLDLGWMVDYWQTKSGRLGTLRQMIEASLSARLLDPDPKRRRLDPIDPTTAGHALNRVGASFLFCGKDSLRVPASGLDLAPAENSIPLGTILPDWADGHQLLLLGRSVFDPATLGRARLHNDNEGTMRCYLAARWLNERLKRNCPLETVFDLLYADPYGYRLVRPDMVETCAWLAGLNQSVADELISRAPFNLVRYGDPGSLPIPVRIRAFGAALAQIETTDRDKLWNLDTSLRRFADPALDVELPAWWQNAAGNEGAQHLILRLILHGQQRGGLKIARAVAFDRSTEDITHLLGARALIALGDPVDQERLSRYIVDNAGTLPRSIVLEGLASLFPARFSVPEFFALIDQIGVKGSDGSQSILPVDGEVVGALATPELVGAFIDAILARSGNFTGNREQNPFREAFSRVAALAAIKFLQWHPDDIPDAVTDLVLLLHETNRYSGVDNEFRLLGTMFAESAGRRRSSFWRAIKRLRSHPYVTDADSLNIWSIQQLGWPVTLIRDDLGWLIEDIRERPELRDRIVALRAAHTLWRQFGEDAELQAQVAQVAVEEPLAAQLALWTNPPPEPPELVAQMTSFEESRERNEAQASERDKSWVDLIAELRAEPSIFDNLSPQTEHSVDSRLFHLWQFLSWRTHSRSRYAIDSLDMVAPIFGQELTQRFGKALIEFAYKRLPVGLSDDAVERRRSTNFDIMALGGLSLAAATVPNWVATLAPDQAAQAAQLALIELNGFPDYLVTLAAFHPDAVRAALLCGVTGQLAAAEPQDHGMLDRLEYADSSLGRLIAPDLVDYIGQHPAIDAGLLQKVASVLLRAMPFQADGFHDTIARRVTEAQNPATAAHYLLILFGLEGDSAVDALRAKMSALDPAGQAALCCILLPRLVGSRFNREVTLPTALSVGRLEQLLILAFDGVRPSDDIERPNGVVYSRQVRDEAQDARNMIFDQLLKIPGEATHAALKRLEQIADFPIRPDWMRMHALRRAEADVVLSAWAPEDVMTFERTFDHPPTTTGDLQLLARRRIEGIQHDLISGKFAQGDTLQLLPDENSVQRWIATQFEARQQEAYTVQRETHYADEKEPDVILISRHSGVELPIEIKVVDRMSIKELEEALVTQLCGQYLRHSGTRHGILLLVYQQARKSGWLLEDGQTFVPYETVLKRLRELARSIREKSATSAQPAVETFDVSQIVSLGEKKRATRAKRSTAENQ